VIFAFLINLLFFYGCFKTENPAGVRSVLPDKTGQTSNLKLVIKDTDSLKAALRGQSSAIAEFELKLIQHGNVSSPFLLMRKKTEISQNQATVTFSNIVPTSVVASLKLTGANIEGQKEFHAGIDLAPGENMLGLVASGEQSLEDVAVRASLLAIDDYSTMTYISSAIFENLAAIGNNLAESDQKDPQKLFEAFKAMVTGAKITDLAAGDTHSLLLREDGTFAAFGSNTFGQLAKNYVSLETERKFVYCHKAIAQVAAGADFSLFLGKNGKVYAAGQNDSAQLGISPAELEQSSSVVEIPGLENMVAIGAGPANGFAIDSAANLYAWGRNDEGQLGTGVQTSYELPRQILSSVQSVAFGSDFCLVCKNDKTVWAAGNNIVAQMAADIGDRSLVFIQIPSLTNVVQVAAGSLHCLALTTSGDVYSWAGNYFGQTGQGVKNIAIESPTQISGINNVEFITAGNNFSLLLTSENNVFGAGDSSYKQLGNIADSNAMVLLENISAVSFLSAGGSHVLAFSGEAAAWGCNNTGQVGNGQVDDDDSSGLAVPASRQLTW
jgi:alpha-tubulin suppressor-like RCC1 family protein